MDDALHGRSTSYFCVLLVVCNQLRTSFAQVPICTPGFFANNGGPCQPCDAGSFSVGGATACSPCGAGTYASGIGSENCSTCTPGSFALPCNMTGAVRYNGRVYAALDGTAPDDYSPGCQSYFLPLPVGWDLAADDETSRQVVGAHPWGANYVLLKGGAGYFTPLSSWATPGSLWTRGLLESNDTAFRARTCNVRILIQFSSNVSDLGGAVSCAACSPGTYAPASQSSECSSCPPGTYSTAHGAMDAEACLSCYDGTFAPAGSSSCALCIFGTYSGAGVRGGAVRGGSGWG